MDFIVFINNLVLKPLLQLPLVASQSPSTTTLIMRLASSSGAGTRGRRVGQLQIPYSSEPP